MIEKLKRAPVKIKFLLFNSIIGILLFWAVIFGFSLMNGHEKAWVSFEENTLEKFELIVALTKEMPRIKSGESKQSFLELKKLLYRYRSLPRVSAQEKDILSKVEKLLSTPEGLNRDQFLENQLDSLEKIASQNFQRRKLEYRTESKRGYVLLILTLMATMIVSGVMGILFSNYVVKNLKELKEGAFAIRRKEYDRPIEIRAQDELGELGQELDHMRKSLFQYIQALTRSNKDLEQFAYVTSHDLQEPLRKVISFGERALKRSKETNQLDDKTCFYLERMMNAATRMRSLIDDLLSYSRISTKASVFKEVHLEKIIKEVMSDLEIVVTEKNATLIPASIEKVMADPVQMRQLFQNLLGNALKFSKENEKPVIKICREDLGAKIKIKVSDNGIGFDQKYAERILIPFQRLHSRSEFDGTGIGLAICNKIVERHGGQLQATSEAGKGSVFSFELYKSN